MTQYLLAVHHAGAGPDLSPDQLKQSLEDVESFNTAVLAAGAFVFAGGLTAVESATVVRSAGSDFHLTDGPFAETREHLGGFWVIRATDLDAALEWAKRAAAACRLPVEVRPFADEPSSAETQVS
jgi:hypothetical protein